MSSDTPTRLRLWTLSAVAAAAVLLVALSALMAIVKEQVRVIGEEAAPQAATASDLYFALSDLDAQVARMVLIAGDDAYAGSQLDALGTYQRRSEQIDAALRASTGSTLPLFQGLTVYRQWVWQALTAESRDKALGYYTQATNTLHLRLLPAARELRDDSRERLDDAYATKQATEITGMVLLVVLGGAVLVLLVLTQRFLARRFRRLLNPALLAATVLTAGLLVTAGSVLVAQSVTLGAARDDSLDPYLSLSAARAVSYDAAADTGRYLLSADLAHYADDFDRKAGTLTEGDGSLAVLSGSGEVGERWAAYQKDHQRIVQLADAGKRTEAIDALTGIRRGDAAFDFFYLDTAVGEITDVHRQDFDAALQRTSDLLAGWVVIPVVAMGLVVLLVPLGVRKRLAEYR